MGQRMLKHHTEQLKIYLQAIMRNDTNYGIRSKLIYAAMHHAAYMDLKLGFKIDPKELEWPVAYIELPTGQVSWHMSEHSIEWDGHTTSDKFDRINKFLDIQ